MAPVSGRTSPEAIPIRVDLPAPFSPRSACTSPAKAVNETSLTALHAAEALRDVRQAQPDASRLMRPVADPDANRRSLQHRHVSTSSSAKARSLPGKTPRRAGKRSGGRPADLAGLPPFPVERPRRSEAALQRLQRLLGGQAGAVARRLRQLRRRRTRRPSANRPSTKFVTILSPGLATTCSPPLVSLMTSG